MAVRDKEVYEERDNALYLAYKEAKKKLYESFDGDSEEARNIHNLALEMAIETRQDRFWITQDRTYRILRLLKSNKMPKTWRTRRKMNEELLAAYERLKKKRMFMGMPLRFIASFVTFEPASGFFMSKSRAGRAIYQQYKMRKPHK